MRKIKHAWREIQQVLKSSNSTLITAQVPEQFELNFEDVESIQATYRKNGDVVYYIQTLTEVIKVVNRREN